MKKLVIILSLFLFISGCEQIQNELDKETPLDQKTLQKASTDFCPKGQALAIDQTDFNFYNVDQQPGKLFVVSMGKKQCAHKANISDGDLTTWLGVNFDGNCLENNSLWELNSVTRQDNQVFANFRRYGTNAGTRQMLVHTHVGKLFSAIRDRVGLQVYVCK